jgi:tetratricopeptide (TPR) repeat protein
MYSVRLRVRSILVGRDRERAILARALEAITLGRGQALAFPGAPGIGKTSLLRSAMEEARERHLACAWGVAWDSAGAPVFWPIVQALRGLAATAAQPAGSALLEAAAHLSSSSKTAHDPADARALLYERSVSALSTLDRPCVVAFDDLHAADTATLELLLFCLRATRGAPILYLLAWRDAEVGERSEAALRALASLAREVEALALRPLAPEEIDELAEGETGHSLSPEALAALHARTLGNPLFVVEILRHAREGELPRTVRQAWAARIERLDADSRRVLEAAAILGDELRLPALAALIERRPEVALAAMSPAIRGGFLVDEGGTSFRFAHPLLRETTLAGIPPDQRSALHRRAACALGELRRAGVSIAPSAIAHHWLSVGPTIDPAIVFEAVCEAADMAARLGADDDAARILDQAVRLLDHMEGAAAFRVDALIRRTEALLRAGRRKEGLDSADEAMTRARATGDPSSVARAALARGLEIQAGVVDPILVRALEEADALLPPGPSALRARVMARLAAARQPAPDADVQLALAKAAVAMADATAGPADLAIVLFNAGAAMVDFGPPEERLPLDRRTYAAALQVGQRAFAIRAAARIVVDHFELGELGEAARWIEIVRAHVDEVRGSHWRWLPLGFDAMLHHARGEVREALAMNDALAALARELDNPSATRTAFIQRMAFLADGGTGEELVRVATTISSALSALENQRIGRLSVAAYRALAGDRDGAIAELERVTFDPAQDARAAPMIAWAQVCSAVSDVEMAKEILPHVDRVDRSWGTWGFVGMNFVGPVDWARGRLLSAAGRPEEAAELLERAAEACRARGMRTARAGVLFDRCRALVEAGASSEARRVLDEVESIAADIGMPILLASIGRLRTSLDDDLSLRLEGDVWRLEHRGRVHHLKAQRGFGMLARLLARPGEEVHVFDLMGIDHPIDAGDAGEVLDDEAKQSYRRRLSRLDAELREAEDAGDADRRERILEERDALARELSRGVGLSGRARRSGAAAERARVNVQRRLKDALRKIAEVDPELGARLEAAVTTGLFCSYRRP